MLKYKKLKLSNMQWCNQTQPYAKAGSECSEQSHPVQLSDPGEFFETASFAECSKNTSQSSLQRQNHGASLPKCRNRLSPKACCNMKCEPIPAFLPAGRIRKLRLEKLNPQDSLTSAFHVRCVLLPGMAGDGFAVHFWFTSGTVIVVRLPFWASRRETHPLRKSGDSSSSTWRQLSNMPCSYNFILPATKLQRNVHYLLQT